MKDLLKPIFSKQKLDRDRIMIGNRSFEGSEESLDKN